MIHPVIVEKKKEIILSMTWLGMADKWACGSEDVCGVWERVAEVGG